MNDRRCALTGGILLAAAMLAHSVILLAIEPGMGFREMRDYLDLDKVVPASSSMAWYVSNVMHVVAGIGLLFLRSGIRSGENPRAMFAASAALAAVPLFVVVGLSGFVMEQLSGLLTDETATDAALYGLLATRMTVLAGAVALFGFMIVAISLQQRLVARWLRVIGIPIGVAAIVFVLLLTPIPLLLFAWSAGFVIDRALPNHGDPGKPEAGE